MKGDRKTRLLEARKTLDFSRREMADAIGIKDYQIKDREIGNVKIDNMFAALLKEKLNINPEWLLTGKGNMFAGKIEIPDDFKIRLENDIKKNIKDFERVKFKNKVKLFLDGYVNLTRKEVIHLAQALKQPVDEYLDLSGYIPESVLEISGGNRKLNILFRKMNELSPEDLDNVLKTLETVVDAYVAKYKKED